jgi:hypothetical protein
LITSCQVSLNLNTGPLRAQISTMLTAPRKVYGVPAA